MIKIRVNKQEVARRQINAAIRMTFNGEDPVAVHSVIAAGHRIIRDICEQRGDIESYLRFTDWIAEGHEKEFWSAMNKTANFLKHADDDANEILDLDDGEADFMIAFASKWYGDLGNMRSIEMNVFAGWWAFQHPKVITPEYLSLVEKSGYLAEFQSTQRAFSNVAITRQDVLKAGKIMLDAALGRR